ncbi:MAG: hypothetical protein OEX18_00775 [Candidatus Krumholzibacteria bacterium]|nr:hypothetical protein [Candidatus Krumholzibacteria bacterium]MDH4335797.1 hypothetical protein [Candidatus Krumholzibacteria bacterium]MDH5269323.1 hypothetical protein [Candidatus Krumholzibacteria bacterium]
MSECAIVDDGPGIRSVYVFHTGNASATASEFSVPLPACWTGASWVGDNVVPGFLTVGTSQTDLSIAYAGCVDLPVFIARINFSVTGKAPPCCRVLVAPPLTQSPQEIVEVSCDYQTHAVGTGLGVTVNPPTSCACDSPTTLRTEPATWGRVKAIFRNC